MKHMEGSHGTGLAVEVTNACYSYERGKKAKKTLSDVNLNVKEGSIYALLGPSGCGKTTLLNCIIGHLRLKKGEIKVFGESPNSSRCVIPGSGVGYMPQELSLYMELTISENLLYFGRLHGVDVKVIQARTDFLLKLLDLPPKCSQVSKLSSGQQRRVSLSVALIHQPPLLILDEPTVGVDPLLRRTIWDQLVQMTANEGMTVIITTHYIAEAVQANVVAFMRNGYILKETNPNQELIDFNESTLEQSFLRLCKTDEINYDSNNSNKEVVNSPQCLSEEKRNLMNLNTLNEQASRPYESYALHTTTQQNNAEQQGQFKEPAVSIILNKTTCFNGNASMGNHRVSCFQKVRSIILKNMSRFRRNVILLVFQFFIPGITALLISACIGNMPYDLPLAVVNDGYYGSGEGHSFKIGLSHSYLEALGERSIIQKPYPDLNLGMLSVQNGDTWGVIHFRQNFSNNLLKRLEEGIDVTDDVLEKSTIDVYLDMTNYPVSVTLQKAIFDSFNEVVSEAFISMGLPTSLTEIPVKLRKPIYGSRDTSFTEYVAPGIIIGITFLFAMGLTTMTIVEERTKGLMERTWVCGATSSQILIGQLLTQLLVLVMQVFITILIMALKIGFQGTVTWLILLTLLQGICGMAFGLLVSVISNDGSVAMIITVGQFFPNTILSAILWPLEGMPHFLRKIAYVLPQTLPCAAVRSIMSRGAGISHIDVWSAFLVVIGWTAFFIIAAILLFRFRK